MKVIVTEIKHSNFVEEEHPRDKDGKFTTKNGSDNNTQSEEVKRHHQRFKESKGGTYSKDDVVFVSGKVKYDKPLDSKIKDEVKRAVDANSKIIIGDAPGADTRVQDYLSELKYDNVEVYTTDETVRNNVGNWPVNKISGEGYTEEREVRRQKDIAMTNAATKGIVVSSSDDRIDSATSLNVDRLIEQNKIIQFYDFKDDKLYGSLKHSDFVEEEHPRDKDGKFASKNSSDTSTDDVKTKISKSQKITMGILATTFGALTATAAIMLLNERNPKTTRQAIEKYINGKWVKVGTWH